MIVPETTSSSVFGRLVVQFRSSTERKEQRETGDQKSFAQKAGINQSTLSRIERGEGAPSLDQILGIAKALDMQASDLVREYERVCSTIESAGITIHSGKIEPSIKENQGTNLVGVGLGLLAGGALAALVGTALSGGETDEA